MNENENGVADYATPFIFGRVNETLFYFTIVKDLVTVCCAFLTDNV